MRSPPASRQNLDKDVKMLGMCNVRQAIVCLAAAGTLGVLLRCNQAQNVLLGLELGWKCLLHVSLGISSATDS